MNNNLLESDRNQGLATLFSNWSDDDIEKELMEGYETICNIPRGMKQSEKYFEYKELSDSVLSVMRFVSISAVVSEKTKSIAETLLKECEVRMSTMGMGSGYCALAIKNKFNRPQPKKELGGNDCRLCESEESLSPIADGQVFCFECEETYYP